MAAAVARSTGGPTEEKVMRWWITARAALGVTRQRRRTIGVIAAALALALLAAGGGSAATRAAKVTTFTGYGFDACNAPKPTTLQAWLASPYRAVGIYIGGRNRACSNPQLSSDWVFAVEAGGWSLIPIYVGLQAPCAAKAGLAKISPGSAASQGAAAADDAVADAGALGLPAGNPIYFDMEGYSISNPACSETVETFVAAWVSQLHVHGYVAGVYGSAASTIRDLETLATAGSPPDDVWIADWNGQQSVFGDPYILDGFWTNHQRLHQYRGGHKETYGGITIDIDSNYLDGAVVGATGSAPPAPTPNPTPTPTPSPPPPTTTTTTTTTTATTTTTPVPTTPTTTVPATSAAGSVSSSDSEASVSWPAGTFPQSVVVTLSPSLPTQPPPGFGAGGYGVQLQVQQTTTGVQATSFSLPLTIHLAPQQGNLAPMYSAAGTTWMPLVQLTADGALPAGARTAYTKQADGSLDILTKASGHFALLPSSTSPPAPAALTGHFVHGSLVLQWPQASDATGPATSYEVTLTNAPLLTVTGAMTASLRTFHPDAPSVYRVIAINAAGNAGPPSRPIVVLPSKRPATLPKALPAWAWQLYHWQQDGKVGARPQAPKTVPAWYWAWVGWRAYPFQIRQ